MGGNGKSAVILLCLFMCSSYAIEFNADGLANLESRILSIESELSEAQSTITMLQSAIPNTLPTLDSITEQVRVISGSLKNGWIFFIGISGILVVVNIMMHLIFILPLNHKIDILAKLRSTPLDKVTKDMLLKPVELKDLNPVEPVVSETTVVRPITMGDSVEEVRADGSV